MSFDILNEGTEFGHYNIEGKIGSGGMGDVYLATDTSLDRKVALKFLAEHLCRDEGCRIRFKREAHIVARLNHPNIITVYEVGEFEKRPFIAMEYCAGRTLRDILKESRTTLEETLDIAMQVCAGLNCAHGLNIVHRDIKPSNIFILDDGRVKVMDFGLAAIVGGEDLTKTGSTLGTVGYMSPEQIKGGKVDRQSDIFSLGVVLYELLTGRHPFKAQHEAAIHHNILHEQPEPLAEHLSDLPDGLQQIIDKALDKDRSLRYQHINDIFVDLKNIFESMDHTKTYQYHFKTIPSRKSRLFKQGIFFGLLAIIIVVVISIPSARQNLKKLLGLQYIPANKHLAILPFVNIGEQATNKAFCDGLMEVLASKITQLEQFQDSFWVVPTSEIRERNIISARQAKRAFGITLAVTGSAQRIGDNVRITLNLIDAVDDYQINSVVIDAVQSDIMALQDSIVYELAELIEVEIQPDKRRILMAGATTNSKAYELYLKGQGYLGYHDDIYKIDSAIILFSGAIDLDSLYALAYTGLGSAYWLKYVNSSEPEWIEPAINNCQKTILLSDQIVAPHVTLGKIYTGTGEYQDAIDEYNSALALDNTVVEAYQGLARTYQLTGNIAAAEDTYKKLIKLKPDFWGGYNDLGIMYFSLGEYDKGVRYMKTVVELLPESDSACNNLGALYYFSGDLENAGAMWERSISIKPNYGAFSNLGSLYYMQHRLLEAAAMYENALALNDKDYSVWANLGGTYNLIEGQQDKAEQACRRAISIGEKLREVNPNNPDLLANLAGCYATVEEGGRARELVEQALGLAPENINIIVRAGVVYERIGDRGRAISLISDGINMGFPVSIIEGLPELHGLLEDPEFKEVVN